jgi:hypothetical protein
MEGSSGIKRKLPDRLVIFTVSSPAITHGFFFGLIRFSAA